MTKIKISELNGPALNWAVAKCEGRKPSHYKGVIRATAHADFPDSPPMFGPELDYSTDWAQGGPIIEREGIAIDFDGHSWCASSNDKPRANYGQTPLIAAMRCYVTSKLGDIVEIPEGVQA